MNKEIPPPLKPDSTLNISKEFLKIDTDLIQDSNKKSTDRLFENFTFSKKHEDISDEED